MGPEVRTTWGRIRPIGFGVDSSFIIFLKASHKVEVENPSNNECHLSYTDSWPQAEFTRNGRNGAPYLSGADLKNKNFGTILVSGSTIA